jgi:hypothetical protein
MAGTGQPSLSMSLPQASREHRRDKRIEKEYGEIVENNR